VPTTSTDIGGEAGFRHEALIYDDPDQFLAAAARFIWGALEAGEPVLVAVSKPKAELLEAELGDDAAGVGFVATEQVGRNPARIIPFWRDFVDREQARPVRGIGEPLWPGRGSAETDECQRHEALLNLAFVPGSDWSLLCTYDGVALSDEVLAAVSCSHQAVTRGGIREANGETQAECNCYAGKLSRHPSETEAFTYDRARLSAVRRRVERAVAEAGVARREAGDLVIAASELAANSVVHGGGRGTMRIWREDGRLLLDFEDRGTIKEPLAGRVRPATSQPGGRGLWLANQLCDLVQIRSNALGTTVRLQTTLA
jgi:anti-sigma regulatory factor (Ser/Thr protein kinase)